MKLIRSWPANIPEGRSYVVDDLDRFIMGADDDPNFDYRRLVELDDDVVLIEWDIAVGGEQLATFMARAKAEPDRVRVAPYLLYRSGGHNGAPQVPFYCHRVRQPGTKTWVTPADPICHMFGFGLVYLPHALLKAFAATMRQGDRFDDTTFSRWHMRCSKHRDVPIDWDCHAVHLHYRTPEVP